MVKKSHIKSLLHDHSFEILAVKMKLKTLVVNVTFLWNWLEILENLLFNFFCSCNMEQMHLLKTNWVEWPCIVYLMVSHGWCSPLKKDHGMTMSLLKNVELCDTGYRFISEQLCHRIWIWVCFVVVFFFNFPSKSFGLDHRILHPIHAFCG